MAERTRKLSPSYGQELEYSRTLHRDIAPAIAGLTYKWHCFWPSGLLKIFSLPQHTFSCIQSMSMHVSALHLHVSHADQTSLHAIIKTHHHVNLSTPRHVQAVFEPRSHESAEYQCLSRSDLAYLAVTHHHRLKCEISPASYKSYSPHRPILSLSQLSDD